MSNIDFTENNPENLIVTELPAGSAAGFRIQLNILFANLTHAINELSGQVRELAVLIGSKAISGGNVSAGTGLSVQVAPYKAVVGRIIGTEGVGQIVGGFPPNSTTNLYLREDQFFTVSDSPPQISDGHGFYLHWATVTTNTSGVTSVDNTRVTFSPSV